MGLKTTASGNRAVAMGQETTASGPDAVSMGKSTTASGDRAVAMGYDTTASGHNAVALQKGLLKAAAFFSAKIRELAEPVTTYEQYKQIASISANSDELGAHTADAWQQRLATCCAEQCGLGLADLATVELDPPHILHGLCERVGLADGEARTCATKTCLEIGRIEREGIVTRMPSLPARAQAKAA